MPKFKVEIPNLPEATLAVNVECSDFTSPARRLAMAVREAAEVHTSDCSGSSWMA